MLCLGRAAAVAHGVVQVRMQLQPVCRISITGALQLSTVWGGGVGFGQEAEGKQLGGSLHSSGDAVLISTSALRSQLPTSPNTKHQLDGN